MLYKVIDLSAYSKLVRVSFSSHNNLNVLYSFNVSNRKNLISLFFGFFTLRLITENSDYCRPPIPKRHLSVRKVKAVRYLRPNFITFSNFIRLRLKILNKLSYPTVKTLYIV